MVLTKQLIKSINVPDIGSNPISSEVYINESNNIIQEKIDNIMFCNGVVKGIPGGGVRIGILVGEGVLVFWYCRQTV